MEHADNILEKVIHLNRGGLCNDDRKIILSMTLSDIAEEFRLPEWMLVRVIETLTMASNEGRRKEREDIERRKKE